MSKLIYFLLGALLYHDLRNRIEGLRQDNDQLLQYVKAENEAAMDWMTDLEGSLEQTTIDAGHAINCTDTEVKLLQLDFYNHLRNYQVWDKDKCEMVTPEPWVEQKLDVDALEIGLKKHLNFTTRRPTSPN